MRQHIPSNALAVIAVVVVVHRIPGVAAVARTHTKAEVRIAATGTLDARMHGRRR